MRPSLLIVIFDFLVSTLMLFIVAPDAGDRAVSIQPEGAPAPAEEFSVAEVTAHFKSSSAEWDRKWTDYQLRRAEEENRRITAELDATNKTMASTNQNLSATRSDLDSAKTIAEQRVRDVENAREQLRKKQSEVESLNAQSQMAQQSLEEAKKTIDETRAREEDLKQKLGHSQITAQELQRDKDTLKIELDEANNRAAGNRPSVSNLGPDESVVGARCEVYLSMEEADVISNDRINAWTYPLLFSAGNRRFLAATTSSLKLDWRELVSDGDIISLTLTYGKPTGDNRWSAPIPGPLLSLSGEPKVILIEVKDTRAMAMAVRPLVGRDRVVAQGLRDTFLVKSASGGAMFRVEASLDLANKRYVRVKPPAGPIRDQIPVIADRSFTPEAGDHLATIEGYIIGIMVSDRVAYILDESDIDNIRFTLPLDNKPEFVRQAKALHAIKP